ncbi:BLUF domain-containing protein [Stenotrophomonas sp. GD03908]|uniref:BLUF domain-containing protein n=1 Tax=Stenotrophomonas maltophilia TaxID=40324 RepID=A0AAJ2WKB7_STEMA|nr:MULTISPECIES: BLUF domain-containing protein [Stenotrophomonas]MBH1481450.1 BLUF domain-containing protein [Stenotrophomonas maltophilia]MDH0979093.1 BLUF domain-containing protein [Stenotrophomonas sp. GD03908]MDQ7293971.1 BLUF domain-containing protein [Stenotrophomonas sp. Sm0041]MDZ5765646.1 BLUF domain-containing protein [Stenotrophomonas maltophilia]
MPLRAIAYVSRALPDLSAERLHRLVEDAARFNKLAGVTGVLLHDDERFLQYIEGPPDGIDSVYERILQAGSHIDIIELGRGRLGQRQFPYWAMRSLPVDAAMLRQLSSSDWSGFTRTLRGDRSAPTPVDLLDQVVQPALHAG